MFTFILQRIFIIIFVQEYTNACIYSNEKLKETVYMSSKYQHVINNPLKQTPK